MLRLKIIFLLLFAFSCAVFSQEYWYGSIDMNKKSFSSYFLDFGKEDYNVPKEITPRVVSSSKGNKMEIINDLQKKGWELIKLDDNKLYFRYDVEQPIKEQEYWYASIDMNKKSFSSYFLDFGKEDYNVPREITPRVVSSPKDNKMEIINELQKKGWEYPAELQYDDSLLIFRFALQKKDVVKKQRYWYASIDMNKKSFSSYFLDFGKEDYNVPKEITPRVVSSSKGNKMEIINDLQKKGWELIKLDDNKLYFRYDVEQPIKEQKYWYASIDMNKKSFSSYFLDFGKENYNVPREITPRVVSSPKDNKMEIINDLQKKGWELIKLDDNKLYFRYDVEQPIKEQEYWYASIDMNKKSFSSYFLDFGKEDYNVPREITPRVVSSPKDNKMEIINNLQEKGWEYPAELQYGDSLLIFRIKLNK